MKLKGVERTANVAWSPASHYPVFLAAGTAAQQLDATFSTTASLELYHMNLNDAASEMELAAKIETDSRFFKLVWGAHGIEDKTSVSGLLMGGAEQGQLFVWDVAKIISGDDPLVHKFSKHTGPVSTLDINPFQINLVASGASESEIFIWDLNNPEKPMTPGTKAQPTHDVTCLAWNQQVQHILASSHGGNCIVWDLRKNEPIIKIRDSMSHIKCGVICWHPEVATQLCIASEDDHTPVIQLWDLRSATSPLKVFENHQRGILSMAWCPCDPDLLLSSGKDNRILCWNPNSEYKMGEVVYELPTGSQWSFDVQWCPRNPAIISSCSFDGHINVHSIMSNSSLADSSRTIDGAFDPFSQSQCGAGDSAVLKKPPKWMRRTVGASFAFGGKLVSFGNAKQPAGQQHARPVRSVYVSQVVTETELVSRSMQLEQTLADGYYTQFCDEKIASSSDLTESTVWSFLKVNFEPDARQQYLKLLGYSHSAVKENVNVSLENSSDNDDTVNDHFPVETRTDNSSPFEAISNKPADSSRLSITVNNESDGLISQALLTANFESAVDVCLRHGRMAEALVLSIAGGAELLAKTQKAYFDANKSSVDRLMWAIVTNNFEHVVKTCDLSNWKEALAIILTYTAGEQFTSLCNLLGRRLETESEGELASDANICYIVAGNIEQLVASWSQNVTDDMSNHTLQDLVEKVMILKNGVEISMQGLASSSGSCLADRLSRYAEILASQGCIKTAMNYLNCTTLEDKSIAVLIDRLSQSLGVSCDKSVPKPFNHIDVMPRLAPAQPTASVVARHHQPATEPTVQKAPEANFVTNGHIGQVNANTRLQQDSNRMTSPLNVSKAPGLTKKYGVVQPATEPSPSDYAGYAQYQQFPSHGSSQPLMQPVGSTAFTSPGIPPGPASNAVYSHQPGTGAWNDPPQQSFAEYSAGPTPFEGKLLNPAEYQPVLPVAQEKYAEQVQPVEPPSMPVAPCVQQSSTLPQEHQILQDIFNRLVQVCSVHASRNPQVKRKLEDVLKKLDNLYTRLLMGNLSVTTVTGLHQIVQAIQHYDYQTALAYHQQIVSAGSFTEISQFMPGIKALIQTALQLQVYI